MTQLSADDHRAIARGQQARRELELTREAFAKVRQALLESIATTTMADAAGRERLYLAVQILPQVEAALVAAVFDGSAAEGLQEIVETMKLGN